METAYGWCMLYRSMFSRNVSKLTSFPVYLAVSELKADIVSSAGNTVWSVSERSEASFSLFVELYKIFASALTLTSNNL